MNKIYSVINSNYGNKNHIIFICDHATNNFFPEYSKNFLNKKTVNSHIAYDIGAKEITSRISKKIKQSCFLSNFSRLIIDPNRNKNDSDLIITNAFGLDLKMNKGIGKVERQKRINKIYNKYHHGLEKLIKEKIKRYKRIFLISIHSFTKKEQGFDRGVEIGLLCNKNMNLLLHIQKELIKNSVHIGRNFPYSGFHYNFTLDKHSKNGLIDNIAIEIRNDLICNEKGIKKYTKLFTKVFKELIND